MIELERHIEILLLSNDCVIVPDLGGFMAHHREAGYDEHDGMFLPPQRTLGFNPQLKLNDSLLAQSYVEAYDISYPEALRRIEAEVGELKQHLDNEGYYELNDIGRLSFNPEGRLEFAPCEAGILTPELYGLSSFEFTPLAQAAKEAALPQPTLVAEASAEEASPSQEGAAITIKMSWIRNAVAVAAALLAFLLMTKPMSEGVQTGISMSKITLPIIKQEAAPQPSPIAPETAPAPEAATAPETAPAAVPDASPSEITPRPAVSPAAPSPAAPAPVPDASQSEAPTLAYCIVAASQVSKKGADEFVKKLKAQGYTSARVNIYKDVRRVIIGSYPTEAGAYTELQKVHQNQDLAEAWVLKVK